MKHLTLAACLVLVALSPLCGQDKKGATVNMDGYTSATPAGWVSEEPSNFLRLAQFRLAKAAGTEEGAELVIFKGITGSAKANVARWKDQFRPPEGKKIDEVSKVTDIKIGDLDATMLDRPFTTARCLRLTPNLDARVAG